ncbi:MAG: DUF2357 domain-containing protein [Opitutaceae bacterium]|nr:DUF2357 domain-containing protein [Cytophagales bacterium]
MSTNNLIIPLFIPGSDREIKLTLYGESAGQTIIEKADAKENGEALVQIIEGCYYEYKISEGYYLQPSEIVSHSKISKSSGRICPNIYVGTLSIDIFETGSDQKCGKVNLEVQSVKTTYREDYRHMLEEITEKCTDLLLQHSSPVAQFFEVDFNADAATLYQRFAFIKSILESIEFNDSVHKILSSPVTRWRESETIKDIRSVRRFHNSTIRQLSKATNRFDLPEGHPLQYKLNSVASKLKVNYKTETVDTPENRFVKHALISFLTFCNDFKTKVKDSARIKTEATLLEEQLEQYLSQSIFKEISSPTTLPLNSPVLQRKEGYREILRVWLMFDLAAKMIWHGGDDVYSGSKRDVAVLYEYWLFFKLLDIIKDVFKIESVATEKLIESTSDGLCLKLKQGKYLPVKGIFSTDTRKLNIEFSYNKTFSGGQDYPAAGSWTRNLRPDYTLSIWPFGISQDHAEEEELIVHIHFDAKYKVENLKGIFGNDDNLENEKEEQKKGTYKRADLLKMHTYKDAIRRTAGAYVLYPGTEKQYTRTGFHELIPGLGAFSIRPSKTNNGSEELKRFLMEVVNHFLNRASQREKISLKVYETYKDETNYELNEPLPEPYGTNRFLLPDSTSVIVGYYKSEDHLNWILKEGLYNARAESNRGSLRLGPNEAGAKYLLLHTKSTLITCKLFKIIETGPRIFSKSTLIKKGYPTHPNGDFYLVYKVSSIQEAEFLDRSWDVSKLDGYKTGRSSGLPFSVTLTQLMKAAVKKTLP